jgi:hypothetical protein
METVLRGLSYDSYLVYLDGMIVNGRTFREHLLNFRKVFERFRETCLELNSEQCHLLQKEVRYLEHTCIVSRERISTDPEKFKVMPEWPTPKNKH